MELKYYLSVVFLVFFAWSGLGLDFSTYQILEKGLTILQAQKGSEDAVKSFLKELAGLESLKDDKHEPIYKNLTTLVIDNKAPINLDDLVNAMKAMKDRLDRGCGTNLEEKIAAHFVDLVLGKKTVYNVVVTGSTRAGKSTFLATLIDPLNSELHKSISRQSIFSHTVNTQHYWAAFDSIEDGFYIARLIDTPGLSEEKSINDALARTDDEIIENIIDGLHGLTVHKVLQIVPLGTSAVNKKDIDALTKIPSTLKDRGIFLDKIDLVFPRADTMSLDNLNALKAQFENYPGIDMEDYGAILYTGTIFNSSFDSGFAESIRLTTGKILKLRSAILKRIFGVEFDEYNNREAWNKLRSTIPKKEVIEDIGFGFKS